MFRKLLAVSSMLLFAVSIANAADTAKPPASLSAAEIVDRNVAASGGLQAWRAVHSMTWTGKLGAGGNRQPPFRTPPEGKKLTSLSTDTHPKDEVQLPFKMEMERPRKKRFEILFRDQTAIQVFDGANGWKLRPYLNRLEVEPFTSDELRLASMQFELDGPLVDYAAKGTRIELDGTEKIDDRDAYKLKLTMKDGRTVHVWVDAKTFLEAKIEGTPRRLDGQEHAVEVYFRDYRAVDGLQIPFVLETKVLPIAKPVKPVAGTFNGVFPVETIAIEKVEVNPKFDASLFAKPVIEAASLVKPH
jgi:outer membrane lipoprotein-sorting protein